MSKAHEGEQFRIVKELKDEYLVRYYVSSRFMQFETREEVNIAFSILMSVDEVYWMQNRTRENINKFNDAYTEALGKYVRRYLI